MATIRLTRRDTYADKIRAYKIFIDCVYHGDIKRNEIKEYEVSNGNHVICAKIDWCRSNELNVSVQDSVVEVEVGSSLTGWKSWFSIIYITFLRHKYLWIRRT